MQRHASSRAARAAAPQGRADRLQPRCAALWFDWVEAPAPCIDCAQALIKHNYCCRPIKLFILTHHLPLPQGPSNLARTSSAPAEGQPELGAPQERRQLTGAWVAAGGCIRASDVLEGGSQPPAQQQPQRQ